jgi:polar amino acid transport system substrate-binding protein
MKAAVKFVALIAPLALFGLAAGGLLMSGAVAQAPETGTARRDWMVGPKPDVSWLSQLRVITETDYPPFNYYDEEGRLAGFNVELANAICRELSVPCDLSAGDWKGLFSSLAKNEADAVIASVAINAKNLGEVDFTQRYYTTPARFAARIGTLPNMSMKPSDLAGRTVAVVEGTAHEAFLKTYFPKARLLTFPTVADARKALQAGTADLHFGDGVSLMFWVQGTDSQRCCEFRGEAYTDPEYFGDGVGIAVKKGNTRLREVLDYALARVKASGRYDELVLRYFPLPLY